MDNNTLIQYVLVGLIFLLAAFLTIRNLAGKKKPGGGCCSCPLNGSCSKQSSVKNKRSKKAC